MLWKVALDSVFFFASKRRVRENDINAVRRSVTDVGASQCVVMANEARILDAVEEHVRHAEHMRKLLLLYGPEPYLH